VSIPVAFVDAFIASIISAFVFDIDFIEITSLFTFDSTLCVFIVVRCIPVNIFVSAPFTLYFVCCTDMPLFSATYFVNACKFL
jgi:hypothetical protein